MYRLSFGARLKSIRKERNLTQSELGELIGVSVQAISKWENDIGMPDISQIVPLARVLNVSTDTLLNYCSDSDNSIIMETIHEARMEKGLYSGYYKLKELRKQYPDNVMLLMELLEFLVAMVYREDELCNIDTFDVCSESERIFKAIISYTNNASDILRARMIMVFLYSFNGNYVKAEEQLPHFPCRADITQNSMIAHIHHLRGQYKKEIIARKWDLLYIFEGMTECIANLGKAYIKNQEYEKAIYTLKIMLEIIDEIFKDEQYIPQLHRRDAGDLYFMLANAYLRIQDIENALVTLEKLWESNKMSVQVFDGKYNLKTPLFQTIPVKWYCSRKMAKKELESMLMLLKDSGFDAFCVDTRYIRITKEIERELATVSN